MSKRQLLLLTLTCAFAFISGCGNLTAINPCDVQLGSHSAVTPQTKNSDWWMPRHEGVLARNAQGNANIIFIGDSITHGWEKTGRAVWDQYYAPLGAVNMGFSGDRTQNVLWRLDNGEIDGINPKLAVIMIGTNNSNGEDNTAEEIADGIKAIVCKLRTDLPKTKILILSIFPRANPAQRSDKASGASFNPQWAKNELASKLASKVADGKMIFYQDVTSAFLDDNGVLQRDIMPDLLHPNEKGYQIWAEAIEPTVKKLMK